MIGAALDYRRDVELIEGGGSLGVGLENCGLAEVVNGRSETQFITQGTNIHWK